MCFLLLQLKQGIMTPINSNLKATGDEEGGGGGGGGGGGRMLRRDRMNVYVNK